MPGPHDAASDGTIEVCRTYLTMDSPDALRPGRTPALPFEVARVQCDPAGYRRLYRAVGEQWHWHDRDAWSDEQLAAHLARPEVGVWVARVEGRTAGFFELEHHADGSVEIAYFGLTPAYLGQGLGGALLTRAVREAWALGATRVWLHTCTLDAPQALPNYLARGFRVEREERYTTTLG